MNEFLSTLALALLPVVGNGIGSLIAESSRMPGWVIGAALHAAAGVAVALVSVDLMPRTQETTATWLFLLLFAAGGLMSYLLSRAALWISQSVEGGSKGAWMVYMATTADLLSDGLMTGASGLIGSEESFFPSSSWHASLAHAHWNFLCP